MPNFVAGLRDRYHAVTFMEDLAKRLKNRIQLSSDAMTAYHDAVEIAFGIERRTIVQRWHRLWNGHGLDERRIIVSR
jgi:hypothetical protein